MANTPRPSTGPGQPMVYCIRIKGQLSSRWAGWFEGMVITLEENGDMFLTGPVVDQAALHGLLKKVRDLGLPLLSITPVEPHQGDAPAALYHTAPGAAEGNSAADAVAGRPAQTNRLKTNHRKDTT